MVVATGAVLVLALLPGVQQQRSAPTEGTTPALRVVAEDEAGTPIELRELWVDLVDQQGKERGPLSKTSAGAIEVRSLESGRYWLVVGAPSHERVVRTISIEAGRPHEEHVTLEASAEGVRESHSRYWAMLGGAIAIGGQADSGERSVSESSSKGALEICFRPVSPDGLELATELVVCTDEGILDGHDEKFPAGPIVLTLGSRGTGRLQVKANGYARAGIDLDFERVDRMDLGDFVLRPARHVKVSLVAPSGARIEPVYWKFGSKADLAVSRRYWDYRSPSVQAVLPLGDEPYVVAAATWIDGEDWQTPHAVFDPSRQGSEFTLTLQRKVSHVLEPTPIHEGQQLLVLDSAGSLVMRDRLFIDVPNRLELIPGDYTLLHRRARSSDEFVSQTVTLGPWPQHLILGH